jgi:signal transduction histidine kinase
MSDAENNRATTGHDRTADEIDGVVTAGHLVALRDVVHDLRGGLTVALGSLELLLSGRAGPVGERQRELIAAARDGVRQTAALAQTVLDVAQLEAGSFPLNLQSLSAMTLAHLAEQVAAPWRAAGQPIGVTIADDTPTIQADHAIVSRLLGNLLNHTARYASGARIDVEGAPAQADPAGEAECDLAGPILELTVCDRDPGLPEDVHAEIARAFDQAEAPYAVAGSGLGLAFCQLAVTAHGGTIRLESPPDGSSRFVIRLPGAE